MVQSGCTAIAFFYSPYLPFPTATLALLGVLTCGMLSLLLTDRFVRPLEAAKRPDLEYEEE